MGLDKHALAMEIGGFHGMWTISAPPLERYRNRHLDPIEGVFLNVMALNHLIEIAMDAEPEVRPNVKKVPAAVARLHRKSQHLSESVLPQMVDSLEVGRIVHTWAEHRPKCLPV